MQEVRVSLKPMPVWSSGKNKIFHLRTKQLDAQETRKAFTFQQLLEDTDFFPTSGGFCNHKTHEETHGKRETGRFVPKRWDPC